MLGWLDTYGRTTVWIFPKPSSIISLNILVRFCHADDSRFSCSSGHDNAYVRSSLADAIAEGVEHWPQVIGQTVHVLQGYYRDKVGLSYVLKYTIFNSVIG
jgi:hypothetical protein